MSRAGSVGGGAAPRESARGIAGLYVLVDDDPRWPRDPVEQARAALEGGARVLQLRVKHAGDRTQLAWARAIAQMTRARGVPLVINDRFDLALACGADGVHLGQEDLPPARVPERARRRLLVGRSTHSLQQVRDALLEPVDYLAFGPIYGTNSKDSEYGPRGIEELARVCALCTGRRVVAIGGIDVGRCAEVVSAGAAAVCVISAVAGADDPRCATAALVRALEGAGAPGG